MTYQRSNEQERPDFTPPSQTSNQWTASHRLIPTFPDQNLSVHWHRRLKREEKIVCVWERWLLTGHTLVLLTHRTITVRGHTHAPARAVRQRSAVNYSCAFVKGTRRSFSWCSMDGFCRLGGHGTTITSERLWARQREQLDKSSISHAFQLCMTYSDVSVCFHEAYPKFPAAIFVDEQAGDNFSSANRSVPGPFPRSVQGGTAF